jgi:sugar/nucleoside kinase (ribokinase family)
MRILVIGGVTIDVLHLPGKPNPITTSGGAGMYTALAGRCGGASVTLFAQRPNPLPAILQPIAQALHWIGPEISLEDLPRLEIAHYGGGKAVLLHASWGAQTHLTPDTLPTDLPAYRFIHLAVMVTPQRQLAFLHTCRERSKALSGDGALISAGTNGKTAHDETETVRELIRQTDLFFMNENEANALFGSVENACAEPGKRLFITLGQHGALVFDGNTRTHVPAPVVTEFDPTGAGDTFCGATLAWLACGLDPVSAASEGVRWASEMIQGLGPERLLGTLLNHEDHDGTRRGN